MNNNVDLVFEQLEQQLKQNIDNVLEKTGYFLINELKENIITADSRYKPSYQPPTLRKTDALFDGFYKEISDNIVTIYNTQFYSSIQSGGIRINKTEKMVKFFWARWYETKDDFWKGLALSKNSYIDIPARDFTKIDEGRLYDYINNAFKNV